MIGQPASSSQLGPEKESAENFELIWVDKSIDILQDARNSEQKLRAIVNSLRTYRSIDETIAFIRTVPNKNVYLIISGELGGRFLKMKGVAELSQIDSIYIFCHEKPDHLYLKTVTYKVRGVFDDVDVLCGRLKDDTARGLTNFIPMSGTSDTADENQEGKRVKFLCSQLNRDLLLSMEYPDDARDDLIAYCSNVYEGNNAESSFIEELRDEYHSGKAIWW